MAVFCSTIIPTVNRSTLARTVSSVLDQNFTAADFEVIVVNDSGRPLPDAEWQHCERVRVIEINRRERSVARNTGVAIARGKYLHFLDDDDLLLPGAMAAFWALDRTSEAAWLYGSYQTVDNEGKLVEEIRPGITGNIFALLVAGEGVPFQTSLLNTEQFYTVGTFDPNPAIIGVEDRDLGRRMALAGTIAYTPAIVAQIRIGEQGSTTDWSSLAESDRLGREKVLSVQNSFTRLRESANSSYWRGRVSRAYLASAAWNLKRRNLLVAMSRLTAGLAMANRYTLAPDFWRGLSDKVK
jgi:glycosyltransferase involved in cell wall biosynthesis